MLQKRAQRLKETAALAREARPEGGRAGHPASRPTRPRALPPHLSAHSPPRGCAVMIPPGSGFTSTRTVSGTQGATAGTAVLARLSSHARRPTAECRQQHLLTAPCRQPPRLSHTHMHMHACGSRTSRKPEGTVKSPHRFRSARTERGAGRLDSIQQMEHVRNTWDFINS